MTEDTFPPPDDEELEAANALRQALEGRPGGPRVPEEALQTAAFLRHTSEGGRLGSERRAKLRAELLASLPPVAAPSPRKEWRRWFGIGITLFGATTAALTVGVLGVREWSTLDRAGEARSQAMETSARDEGHAAAPAEAFPAAPALAPAPPAELAKPTLQAPQRPSEPSAEALAEPSLAPRSLGGGARVEREAPSANELRRAAPGSATPSAGPIAAAAPSKSRARAPGAFAAEGAEDGAVALGSANELSGSVRAAESKGRAAAGSAPSAADRATPVESNEVRVQRQRREQRERLLARIGSERVRSAYRAADGARTVAQLESASAQLSALSSAGLGGTSTALEAEQLRPDVYCRLAELSLRLAQPRAALDWVRQGLRLGNEPSPFVACLYQHQGRAREALGDRNGAAESYMNALKVNEQLLNESLEAP